MLQSKVHGSPRIAATGAFGRGERVVIRRRAVASCLAVIDGVTVLIEVATPFPISWNDGGNPVPARWGRPTIPATTWGRRFRNPLLRRTTFIAMGDAGGV